MLKIKKDKLYLVTGGSGFLGTCLIKRIINQGGRVRVIARNEGNLISLKQLFPTIEIITGDIYDICIVRKALIDVNAIFHLSAFKHVTLAEEQSRQCVYSNIYGTLNLLNVIDGKQLDFMLSISTDKAAQVVGVYGATKLLMERLIEEFEKDNPQIQQRIVRYGNILYSTGSVLNKWKKLLQQGQELIVTDLNATRFFWSVEQAVDLIFECLENAKDSSLYCPEMKATRINALLMAMYAKYGVGKLKYKEIGLQVGENLHEKVLNEGPYSNEVEQYSVSELIKMI